MLTGTCDSWLKTGNVDEDFYFEFSNNFNAEQCKENNDGGASPNAYQNVQDISIIFDIPTKPQEAGLDNKKLNRQNELSTHTVTWI